jgi:four helix bundle protein
MSSLFGHEHLRVYKASVAFVVFGDSLLKLVEGKASACDHLSRAMEGIPLHIAHANNSWSAKERITYLGHANGSVLECAGCLDVLVARRMSSTDQMVPGKELLRQVCGMLIVMQRSAADRVREEVGDEYTTKGDLFFSHERLDVYRVALDFVAWVNALCVGVTGRQDLVDRLDKYSTGIVLNIAEGNGRFTPADHSRFLGIAHAAVVKSAATLDLAVARHLVEADNIREGRRMLERMAAMLTAMVRGMRNSSSN